MTGTTPSETDTLRLWWSTWAGLLVLTAIMLYVGTAAMTRTLAVGILLVAMLGQVALIAAHFMHLRHAHVGLIWTFIAGLLITGLTLYVLIVPDAIRIHEMGVSR